MEHLSGTVCASRLSQLFINYHTIHIVWHCDVSTMFCLQGSPEAEVVNVPCVTGPGGGRTALSVEARTFVSLWLVYSFLSSVHKAQMVDKHACG